MLCFLAEGMFGDGFGWFPQTKQMTRTKTLARDAKLSDQQLEKFLVDAVNESIIHAEPLERRSGVLIGISPIAESDFDEPDKTPSAGDARTKTFFRMHNRFFPTTKEEVDAVFPSVQFVWNDKAVVSQKWLNFLLDTLRRGLKSIWEAPDEYTANWRLFAYQHEMHTLCGVRPPGYDYKSQPPAPEAPLNQAFDFLRRRLRLLKKCKNPECNRSPYFVASRGNQQYCSDACAATGQSKSKLQWWSEKGRQWREERLEASEVKTAKGRKGRK